MSVSETLNHFIWKGKPPQVIKKKKKLSSEVKSYILTEVLEYISPSVYYPAFQKLETHSG